MDGIIIIGTKLDTKQLEKELKELDKYEINDKKIKIQTDRKAIREQLEEYYKERAKLDEEYINKFLGHNNISEIEGFGDWKKRSQDLEKQWQPLREQWRELFDQEKFINAYIEQNKELQITEQELEKIKQQKEEIKQKQDETTQATQEQNQAVEEQSQVTQEQTQAVEEQSEATDDIEDEYINIEQMAKEVCKTLYQLTGVSLDWRELLAEAFDEPEKKSKELNKTMKNISKSVEAMGKKMFKTGLAMLGIQSVMGLFRQSFARVLKDHPAMQNAIDHIKGAVDVVVQKLITTIEPFLPKLIPLIDKIATMVLKICDILTTKMKPVLEFLILLASALVDYLAEAVYYLSFGLIDFRVTTEEINNMSKSAEKFADKIRASRKEGQKLRKQLMGFDEMNILNKDGSTSALGTGGTDYTSGTKGVGTIDKTKAVKQVAENIFDSIGEVTKIKALSLLGPLGIIGYYLLGKDSGKTKRDIKLIGNMADSVLRQIREKLIGAKTTFKDNLVYITTETGEVFTYTYDEYEALMQDLWLTTDKTTGKIGMDFKNLGATCGNVFEKDIPNSADTGTGLAIDTIWNKINAFNQDGPKAKIEVKQDDKNDIDKVTDDITKTLNFFHPQVKASIDGSYFTGGITGAINSYTPPLIKASIDKNNLQTGIKKAIGSIIITPEMIGGVTGGLNKWKLTASSYGAKGLLIGLPHLAQGGIINRVGKGVPLALGGAIAGERGREAVVPLTDTQQMQYLGREIAKHIVVNLENEINIDGRQLARSVSQVMGEMQFESNGGVI